MSALSELRNISQSGDRHRRWFASDTLDLIVWYDESRVPLGFHLCYDKGRDERAILWSIERGLEFALVDDGEGDLSRHKESPVLRVQPGVKEQTGTAGELFNSACGDLPRDIVDFVNAKLSQSSF